MLVRNALLRVAMIEKWRDRLPSVRLFSFSLEGPAPVGPLHSFFVFYLYSRFGRTAELPAEKRLRQIMPLLGYDRNPTRSIPC